MIYNKRITKLQNAAMKKESKKAYVKFLDSIEKVFRHSKLISKGKNTNSNDIGISLRDLKHLLDKISKSEIINLVPLGILTNL